MAVDPTAVIVASITSLPATLAALYAATKARTASSQGERNESILHDLSNGLMDEKIKAAIREVLQQRRLTVRDDRVSLDDRINKHIRQAISEVFNERPELITEGKIIAAIDRLLSKHLKEET